MFEEKFKQLGGLVPLTTTEFDRFTDAEIAEVEELTGAALSPDYKSFLQQYGESRFEEIVNFKPEITTAIYPTNDELEEDNPEFHGSQVSLFFGKDESYPDSLIAKIKIYKDRMPKGFIPVADDGLGNKICLSLENKSFGQVYFWDHNNEWDEEDYEDATGREMSDEAKYQNVYLVAESFTAFIDKLQVQ